MAEFTLKIDGMHCGACVRRVTQALCLGGRSGGQRGDGGRGEADFCAGEPRPWILRLPQWPKPVLPRT